MYVPSEPQPQSTVEKETVTNVLLVLTDYIFLINTSPGLPSDIFSKKRTNWQPRQRRVTDPCIVEHVEIFVT